MHTHTGEQNAHITSETEPQRTGLSKQEGKAYRVCKRTRQQGQPPALRAGHAIGRRAICSSPFLVWGTQDGREFLLGMLYSWCLQGVSVQL